MALLQEQADAFNLLKIHIGALEAETTPLTPSMSARIHPPLNPKHCKNVGGKHRVTRMQALSVTTVTHA